MLTLFKKIGDRPIFFYFARMKRTLLITCLLAAGPLLLIAQTTKNTAQLQQIWLGYFNQPRFSNKWGSWVDVHLRTKEDFTNSFSQSIFRVGLTYYLTDNAKFTAAYGRVYIYPQDNHGKVTRPEHRPWQQFQWHTSFTKTRLMQWIRLEERFRKKVLNDSTLADGYNFNWRLRYNIWYEIPITGNGLKPKNLSFILNDELHINLGREVVYNYFDQNRFFAGFKYQISKSTNIQAGYSNIFIQLGSGNSYKNINAARVFLFQNFDFRKKS